VWKTNYISSFLSVKSDLILREDRLLVTLLREIIGATDGEGTGGWRNISPCDFKMLSVRTSQVNWMRDKISVNKISLEQLTRKDHWREQGVDQRIILKFLVTIKGAIGWIGFIQLKDLNNMGFVNTPLISWRNVFTLLHQNYGKVLNDLHKIRNGVDRRS
jgi:hypothetical protein